MYCEHVDIQYVETYNCIKYTFEFLRVNINFNAFNISFFILLWKV